MTKKKFIACFLTITAIISAMMLPATASADVTTSDSVEINILDSNEMTYDNDISFDEEKGVICSCGIPLSEHEQNSNLRYSECVCGGKIVAVSPVYGQWHYSTKSRTCTHKFLNGHDYEEVRTYVSGARCTSCSYYSEKTGQETRCDCKGF